MNNEIKIDILCIIISLLNKGSPFSKYFRDCEKSTMEGIRSEDENRINAIYNSSFIAFLQFYFMPINFLWANYISCLDLNKHAIDPGSLVESTIRKRKKLIGQAVFPSHYVNKTLCATIETCNSEESDCFFKPCFYKTIENQETPPLFGMKSQNKSSGLNICFTRIPCNLNF